MRSVSQTARPYISEPALQHVIFELRDWLAMVLEHAPCAIADPRSETGILMATALKQEVRDYWNARPCGADLADAERMSRAYFDRLREIRYAREPEILRFADFLSGRDKKVLEVGVGTGTDFAEWCRAGAEAHGVDLTPEGIEYTRNRLAVNGLSAASLRVGDAETLPFPDNSFDIAYSWGVIHHSPDTPRALAELVRVTKPGGVVKVMIYHLASPVVWFKWLAWAAWRGQDRRWAMAHHLESPGTKAYTFDEARALCTGLPVTLTEIRAPLTYYDYLKMRGPLARFVGHLACAFFDPESGGFFLHLSMTKSADATGSRDATR